MRSRAVSLPSACCAAIALVAAAEARLGAAVLELAPESPSWLLPCWRLTLMDSMASEAGGIALSLTIKRGNDVTGTKGRREMTRGR